MITNLGPKFVRLAVVQRQLKVSCTTSKVVRFAYLHDIAYRS